MSDYYRRLRKLAGRAINHIISCHAAHPNFIEELKREFNALETERQTAQENLQHPMAKDYLKEMCRAVEARLPDNHGFIVFAFPHHGGRMFYASNTQREDAVRALKEWLIQSSGEEDWMKHIK